MTTQAARNLFHTDGRNLAYRVDRYEAVVFRAGPGWVWWLSHAGDLIAIAPRTSPTPEAACFTAVDLIAGHSECLDVFTQQLANLAAA